LCPELPKKGELPPGTSARKTGGEAYRERIKEIVYTKRHAKRASKGKRKGPTKKKGCVRIRRGQKGRTAVICTGRVWCHMREHHDKRKRMRVKAEGIWGQDGTSCVRVNTRRSASCRSNNQQVNKTCLRRGKGLMCLQEKRRGGVGLEGK